MKGRAGFVRETRESTKPVANPVAGRLHHFCAGHNDAELRGCVEIAQRHAHESGTRFRLPTVRPYGSASLSAGSRYDEHPDLKAGVRNVSEATLGQSIQVERRS